MKKINIKYNPYTIYTEVIVDGEMPEENNSLNFGRMRLQEWVGELPSLLDQQYSDKNFEIDFTGTLADFEDLKQAFDVQEKVLANFVHHRTPDVSETEDEVNKIFDEIKKGPIEELKGEEIISSFEKAQNEEFEISVVATMSSGKSTLINALLHHKLMPVAAKATTATIVSIKETATDIDEDLYNSKFFSGVAYDANDAIVEENSNVSYNLMKEWNKNPNISCIEIKGHIPCISNVGMRLILVDTPGPNNSGDKTHREKTFKKLKNSDKSLVLFVMNAENLDVDDETAFLDFVCDCMKKGGKQSRDRYIFVVNKLDRYKIEDDDINEALQGVKNKLESKGICNPNIFPATAEIALELRTNDFTSDYEGFKENTRVHNNYHFESYYHFSHLPEMIKQKINGMKRNANEKEIIEIHSGIVSIEEAIGLYINKYSRTIKIKDLVDSFNSKLNDLATFANIEKAIRDDETKKARIEEHIKQIKDSLQTTEKVKECSEIIESLDLTKGLADKVNQSLNSIRSSITEIASVNTSKLELSKAKKACKKIDKEFDDKIIQMQLDIEDIVNTAYNNAIADILDKYTIYLSQLNIQASTDEFSFSPISLVSSELKKITADSELLYKYSHEETEKVKIKVPKKVRVEGNRGTMAVKGGFWGTVLAGAALAADALGGCGVFTALAAGAGIGAAAGAAAGDDDRVINSETETEVDKQVTYVDMAELVSSYFEPIQLKLAQIPEEVVEYVNSETLKLKDVLKEKLTEINMLVQQKLEELSNTQQKKEQTQEEIRKKEHDLEWLEGIQNRVNKLINF